MEFGFYHVDRLVGWLVGWSLTSLFSTNTAISETNVDRCSCDTGETAPSSSCSSQHYVSVAPKPVGYIVSDVTQTTGVGSERCPWLVSARRGQRIRVTLYDLGSSTSLTM